MNIGEIERLIVSRFTDNGAYLMDTDETEVLLPNRYCTDDMKIGDEVRVFIYKDSEERLVACTDMPYIIVGEVAVLECVDVSPFGAFLDWGLYKDLFIPIANQKMEKQMEVGNWYLVYAYLDNLTQRVVATEKLGRYINNEELTIAVKDEVEIVVGYENEYGYRVVINNKHWGMIYHNQIFKEIKTGDILTAYVARITEDNRVDVSLNRIGFGQVEESAETVERLLTEGDGSVPLGDKSSPDEIYSATGMSKKMFKRGAGKLLKEGKIEINDFSIIRLKK